MRTTTTPTAAKIASRIFQARPSPVRLLAMTCLHSYLLSRKSSARDCTGPAGCVQATAEIEASLQASLQSDDCTWGCSGRLGSRGCGGGQDAGELRARADAELREHPIEVRAHRAGREVEPLADLAVAQSAGGELRDLQLLRGQVISRIGCSADARLSRGTQLLTRGLSQAAKREGVEVLPCRPKRHAGVGDSSLATQPAAVVEQQASPVAGPVGEAGAEGRLVELLGLVVGRKKWPRVAECGAQESSRGLGCQ